ncbi:chromate transporter [Paenibacillus alkaliterrae]|uniref:chromate transporter n=1 Tax=Paenibacillus alkaliterrae TaxID=320909 RepID=UPI001F3A5506|nr:chromate transporter [Paenibacillus alkaliterrae]MCF2940047.1 chromate transporter [Paenibacillus alkaliterrae]
MLLLDLFFTFFVIGFVSFGGGYAMIPLIQEEAVHRHGWLDAQQFTDIIAVAGMSPGPIATNIAIFIGVQEAGFLGAVVAAAGMVLPSLLIILGVGMVFFRIYQNKWLQSSFYGLRSIITGLIIYAAIIFAVNNGLVSSLSWFTVSQLLIFIGSLAALLIFRKHPVYIIIVSGLVGIAVYG